MIVKSPIGEAFTRLPPTVARCRTGPEATQERYSANGGTPQRSSMGSMAPRYRRPSRTQVRPRSCSDRKTSGASSSDSGRWTNRSVPPATSTGVPAAPAAAALAALAGAGAAGPIAFSRAGASRIQGGTMPQPTQRSRAGPAGKARCCSSSRAMARRMEA